MPDPIGTLRVWERFHVRITLLYAAVVLVALTVSAVVGSEVAWRGAMSGLRARMALTVQAVADGVDPEDLDDPRLVERLARIGGLDPEMTALYVLRWDPDPRRLRFVVDWEASPDQRRATPGEPYDASELPVLLRGFEATEVEDRPYEDEWGPSLSAYGPIRAADGGPLALVGVDVRLAALRAMHLRILAATAGAWTLAVGLIGLASVLVGRNVRDPLLRVIQGTALIAAGRFGTRLNLVRRDEFGLLSLHFDQMAEGLEERERIRATLGRYVSPDVARQLLAEHRTELGGEERDVTVLFADLRSYATLSEHLPPTRLIELLNRWLGPMQEEIDREGGTVIEFLGDAILAVFGAPLGSPDHAERAVRCALGMRRSGEALELSLRAEGVAAMGHRIGIHSGRVVAGNIGSATRTKYTVIGDAVNVAARLEQLNKELGTDILVSGETIDRLPPGAVRTVDHGPHRVKGRDEPVRVLSLASEAP